MFFVGSSVPKRRHVGDVERLPRVGVPAGRGLHAVAVAGPGAVAAPARRRAAQARPRAAAPLAAAQQPARRHTQRHAAAAGRHILHWRGETLLQIKDYSTAFRW